MVTEDSSQREDMLETERRTAISISQLGLYSDHSDRETRSRYGLITRKFAIGVMVVGAVVLVGIFLYDFASATAVNSKVNQESKHMYILQHALRKPTNATRKFVNGSATNRSVLGHPVSLQDRSDNGNNMFPYAGVGNNELPDAELRTQNLNNYKLRKRVLKSVDGNGDASPAEGKQLFDNHAAVYRVRQRHRYPSSIDDDESSEESRPTPFHWELKSQQPTAFKRLKYPQLTQYRYPHASRSIQDIIKYLTNEAELPNRGIKFTGVYVNPKKYDMTSDIGEMMSNSDRSEEEDGYPYSNEDPFYQYKPKHPGDVNLLATSNVRFAPTGLQRYNPYYDPYNRPVTYAAQPLPATDQQYENVAAYNPAKRRKPKPFSVMLDIYPITDVLEQSKKNTRPKQVPADDYDIRRPFQSNRVPKFYAPVPPQQMLAVPNQPLTDEEERQQMIFHLNLYPKRKNKMSRHDIIHRSQSMDPEDQQQFVNKVWTPIETIAKHLAVARSKHVENESPSGFVASRYQETVLDGKEETKNASTDDSEKPVTVPANHKSSVEEDYASTEKYEYEAMKIVGTTVENEVEDVTTVIPETTTVKEVKSEDVTKDLDTVEGFKRFAETVSVN
ncbi:uncharacterized protein LOC117225804 [Megalopta genalis]|uniref:uncharacterized protein LOC117225804 n=1 Tax=Megalopta genalis TaxID=115081 RepID=UPI003FCF89CA